MSATMSYSCTVCLASGTRSSAAIVIEVITGIDAQIVVFPPAFRGRRNDLPLVSAKHLYAIHCLDDQSCGRAEGDPRGGSTKRMACYPAHKVRRELRRSICLKFSALSVPLAKVRSGT